MEFREIPGFPAYEISNTGIVKRVARPTRRFRGNFPRIITPQYTGKRPNQQQSVLLHDAAGRPWTKMVAALVAVAFLGPRPSPQHCVNYKDGDRDNHVLDNLYWGPRPKLPNVRQGRSLTAEDVLAIRRRYSGLHGELRALAKAFGTTPQNIQLIVSRRRWAHLPMH